MQRRAVAVYVGLFVLVGATVGVLVATAESPDVTFEDPDYQLGEGDTFEHDGQTYTVAEIAEQEEEDDLGRVDVQLEGTIEWEEDGETRSEEVTQQGSITLGETEYVTYFPDGETLILSSDQEAYQAQLAEIDQFEQRVTGLTRIIWLVGATILALGALAFLPSRY